MTGKEKRLSPGSHIVLLLVLLNALVLERAFVTDSKCYLILLVTIPLLLVATTYLKNGKEAPSKRESDWEADVYTGSCSN